MSTSVFRCITSGAVEETRVPLALAAVSPNARYAAEETENGVWYGSGNQKVQLRLRSAETGAGYLPVCDFSVTTQLNDVLNYHIPAVRRPLLFHNVCLAENMNCIPPQLNWWLTRGGPGALPLALQFRCSQALARQEKREFQCPVVSLALTICGEEFVHDLTDIAPFKDDMKAFFLIGKLMSGAGLLHVDELAQCTQLELACFAAVKSGLDSTAWLQHCHNLKTLSFLQCDDLRSLQQICGLSSLRSLSVEHCKRVTDYSALSSCPQLEHLMLAGCPGLENLDLKKYYHLRFLLIQCVSTLISVCVADCHSLRTLLLHTDNLETVSGVSGKAFLEEIQLSGNVSALDLSGCVSLSRLTVYRCPQMASLVGVEECEKLEMLSLEGENTLRCLGVLRSDGVENVVVSFHHIASTERLEQLSICSCATVTAVDLSSLKNLEVVSIGEFDRLTSVTGLAELQALRDLDLSTCSVLSSLDLSDLGKLQEVNISNCQRLSSVSGLTHKPDLQRVVVARCDQIVEVDLEGCAKLSSCSFSSCERLTSVKGLHTATKLCYLNLRCCPALCFVDALVTLSLPSPSTVVKCPKLTPSADGRYHFVQPLKDLPV